MADKQIPKGFEYHIPDDYSITPTDRCMMALHSLGEVFDVFENYQSPIELMLGEFRMEQENEILKAVQECGVSVDKDELVKALQYDRGQYEKGFMNGYAKAKIELDAEREEWSRSATTEQLKNIELQAEIEQLKKDKDGLAVALANAVGRNVGFKEDIERLQNDLAISRKETKRYATRRAEAIKEFAERLKDKHFCFGSLQCDKLVSKYAVELFEIDNLVKEMAGDDK